MDQKTEVIKSLREVAVNLDALIVRVLDLKLEGNEAYSAVTFLKSAIDNIHSATVEIQKTGE